jgi:hypothetical protein
MTLVTTNRLERMSKLEMVKMWETMLVKGMMWETMLVKGMMWETMWERM